MATLKSRWLEWQPSPVVVSIEPEPVAAPTADDPSSEPNIRGKDTDKTDKSPSVSFVSSFFGHIAADEGSVIGIWDAEAWRDHFEERAAIIEFDGGLAYLEAGHQAFADTVEQWLFMHPPEPTEDTAGCVHCNAGLGEDGVPVLAGGAHTWIHSQCHHAWLTERRRHAAEKLCAMGIRTMRR